VQYLIVNGDDFGITDGVSLGIIEAHRRGILTSTSLMVDRAAAAAAAALTREAPALSLGIHLELEGAALADPRASIARQLECFERLIGRPPTHIDSHHDAHRDARVLPHVLEYGRRLAIPVRSHSAVTCFGKFYGHWGGEDHPKQVGVDSLVRMLETKLSDGVTELICHPGYVDEELDSSYGAVRETEIATLCDVRVREALGRLGIRLIGFRDVPALIAHNLPGTTGVG
jgi:predicted glycoside hydrolase/deacetylase ChbG (UPF0249 family)